MRAIVYTLIFVIWFVGSQVATANAQFTKDTGLFAPRNNTPTVIRVDDSQTLYWVKGGTEEWIFCVITSEYEETLEAVILIKTARTEYVGRCPIMLVVSGKIDGENSINFSIGLGDALRIDKIPVLYLSKENHTFKWIRREFQKRVVNTRPEGETSFQ